MRPLVKRRADFLHQRGGVTQRLGHMLQRDKVLIKAGQGHEGRHMLPVLVTGPLTIV